MSVVAPLLAAALTAPTPAAAAGTATPGAAAAGTTTYSKTITIPVPPASAYQGSGDGDGWAVALSSRAVYNVFHHQDSLGVACHLQIDASECPGYPLRITDPGTGGDFGVEGQPGLWLDQATGHLFVFASRLSDATAGVVCIDTTQPATNSDPYCGFTALSAVGDAPQNSNDGTTGISDPVVVNSRWYAFNYVNGAPSGTRDKLMCFSLTTFSPCASQPYTVAIGAGNVSVIAFPSPSIATVANQIIVPISFDSGSAELACFNAATSSACAGNWPASTTNLNYPAPSNDSSVGGAAFPMLDATGSPTGVCIPITADPCFALNGSPVATPAGLSAAVSPNPGWDGPGMTIGSRVYVPGGTFFGGDAVNCFDYSIGAACPNFPKIFGGSLDLLYTVNPDPQRPTCIWVNSDNGASQIQNIDAFSGQGCGEGPVRVLASNIVPPAPVCVPVSYQSLQVLDPPRATYSDGTVQFEDGDGNPIGGAGPKALDNTGTVDLTGLNLDANGLPQFLIDLNGLAGPPGSVTVKLTWLGSDDPTCRGATPSTTTIQSSLNPSHFSDNVTFTADASGDGGGTVTFTADGTPLLGCDSVPLQPGSDGGIATCSTDSLSVGGHDISASYSGDDKYAGSTADLTQEVDKAPTVLTVTPAVLSISPLKAYIFKLSATLRYTATPVAQKTIQFSAGGRALCSAATDAGGGATCSVLLSAGPLVNIVLAKGYSGSFAGDASYKASAGSNQLVTYGCTGVGGTGTLGGDQCPPPAPTITTNTTGLPAALGDSTNPMLTVTVGDPDTSVDPSDITVTAASSNQAVATSNGIAVSGTGRTRTVSITPGGSVGFATITLTATSPGNTKATTTVNYAVSAAQGDPSDRYYTGAGNASAAVDAGNGYVLVADDEDNRIRLYNQTASGPPVSTFDFTGSLPRGTADIDVEAAARTGNTIYWLGSQSNNADGSTAPARSTLFATQVTGSGAGTTLSYLGAYSGLQADLVNWDNSNGGQLGFASSVSGANSPSAGALTIEGLEFAGSSSSTAYLAFRSPLEPTGNRHLALVVPVTNINTLIGGGGPATFGAPMEWDLNGLGIRDLRENADGQYLLIAGTADGTNSSSALYQWDGKAGDAPVRTQTTVPSVPATADPGAWEAIVSVPDPLVANAKVRLVEDNGDTAWYGDSSTANSGLAPPLAKDLARTVAYVPALAAPPAITSISPSSGPLGGGTTVTITGTGFTDATAVQFGSAGRAASFTAVSDTSITAVSPAAAASGSVDIRVTTPAGTSPPVAADAFQYGAAPTLTSITPASGPMAGGTTVTISGSGFTGATAVQFGSAGNATSFTVVSDSKVTAVAPATTTAGLSVNVTVTTPGGTSAKVAGDVYRYAPVPAVTSISPTSGPMVGGNSVTINGSGFTGATKVTFGSVGLATSFTVVSDTKVTAVAPATATSGLSVHVTVTTPGGASGKVAGDVYRYAPVPAVTSISPTSGPAAGGTTVTITGSGFTGATKVTFGSAGLARSFTVVSDSTITAVAPAGSSGLAVHLTVTTPGGTSTKVTADIYQYT